MGGHGLNDDWGAPAQSGSSPTPPARALAHRAGSNDLLALLQVVGVAWIIANQFREPIAALAGGRVAIVDKGYLGAALFFFAEGRLLLDRYDGRTVGGSSSYLAWIGERLAWLYPLHGLILLALVVAVVAPLGLAPQHSASFGARDVFAHLTLTQAWGLAGADSWNFPAWLVSADWGLVLALPLVAPLLHRRPAFMVAFGSSVFFFGSIIANALGRLFADLTTLGLLQAIPAALVGAAWRAWINSRAVSALLPTLGVAATFGWIVIAATWKLPDVVIWPALGGLAFFVWVWPRSSAPRPAGSQRVRGEAAIALQLTYLPVEMLGRRLAAAFQRSSELSAWELTLLVTATAGIAATAYLVVQRPAHRWLMRKIATAPEPLSQPPKT